jgi:hypothetical protein
MSGTTKEHQSRRRIGLIDRQAIEASLDIAALALLPEEYSQRDVFKVLMPKLFVMRKRGFGFKQITKLLNEAGLKLAIGSVRTYYHEFLMEMLESCESYFRAAEKTLNPGRSDGGLALRPSVDREAAVSQAQAQVRSHVGDQAQARAQATLGRLVGGSGRDAIGQAPQNGAAGAWLAPAPAGGLIARPPESPAPRGTKPAPVPGVTPSLKKPPPSRQASPPSTLSPPQPLVAAGAGNGAVTCVTAPEKDKIKEEPGLPTEVYGSEPLEHPAIKGLLLTREQRFYTMRLQFRLADGEIRMEKGAEMIARRSWQVPHAVRTGRTSSDFVEMQAGILGKPKN